MTPKERTMPVLVARWKPGYGWVFNLPDGRERVAVDAEEARRIVDRECPGTSIRWEGRER